jgi:3-oxoadipate enol-lactonase
MRLAVELHHVIEGPPDAPVLVMMHPLGSNLAMWQAQAAALVGNARVIRCDLRGHGRSPVPPGPYEIADLAVDVIALLNRLEVDKADLCGLSLGGMVGMHLAAHNADRVRRLVVCCTSAMLGPPERWIDRAAQVRRAGTESIADDVVARWFTPGFFARSRKIVAEHRAAVAASPAEGYAACCAAIQRMDLRSQLPSIRAPTLAIAGADDPSTPPEHLVRIADAIPRARLVVLEGAAHLAAVEKADEVTALITAHLAGAES